MVTFYHNASLAADVTSWATFVDLKGLVARRCCRGGGRRRGREGGRDRGITAACGSSTDFCFSVCVCVGPVLGVRLVPLCVHLHLSVSVSVWASHMHGHRNDEIERGLRRSLCCDSVKCVKINMCEVN